MRGCGPILPLKPFAFNCLLSNPSARNISDTVVCVGEGEVLKTGTPEEVFKEEFIRRLYHLDDTDIDMLGEVLWLK